MLNKIRLSKVLKECNISLERAIYILEAAGKIVEKNPNSKISEEDYLIIVEASIQHHKFLNEQDLSIKLKLQEAKLNKEKIINDEKIRRFEKTGLVTKPVLLEKRKKIGNPKVIYKYMSSDYILNTLRDNYLFFNSFSNFNDPFDCNINLFDFNKEVDSKTGLRKLKDKEKQFQKELNSYKICCFTRTQNNLLMWGHYANSHKGVCLGFSAESSDLNALDMHYTKEFTKANFFPFDEDKLHHVFYSKSFEWEYEQEMRVVKNNLKDGRFIFNPQELISICFGLNINTKLKKDLLKIIKEKYKHIKVFQAQMDLNSYNLNYLEITFKPTDKQYKSFKSKRLTKKVSEKLNLNQ